MRYPPFTLDHVHSCVMAYPDGYRLEEPRRTPNLRVWILSNKTFHPSAALFVDGACRYPGHLTDEQIAAVQRDLRSAPTTTSPTSQGDQP